MFGLFSLASKLYSSTFVTGAKIPKISFPRTIDLQYFPLCAALFSTSSPCLLSRCSLLNLKSLFIISLLSSQPQVPVYYLAALFSTSSPCLLSRCSLLRPASPCFRSALLSSQPQVPVYYLAALFSTSSPCLLSRCSLLNLKSLFIISLLSSQPQVPVYYLFRLAIRLSSVYSQYLYSPVGVPVCMCVCV